MRQFRVVVNGNEYNVAIEEIADDKGGAAAPQPKLQAPAAAPPQQPKPQAAQPAAPASGNGSGRVTAAMPGTILNVLVNVGDTVVRGQPLLILEAMKMENEIMASHDGTVEEVLVAKGASVNSGDLLMVVN